MTAQRHVSIFLADDHEMILPGMRLMLENEPGFEVVGMATDGLEAYRAILELRPDVAVLDLSIPSMSGFEVIARLHKEGCRTRFVILTSYAEDMYIKEALSLGVDSYILKENSSTELLAALNAVSKGLRYMAPKVLSWMMQGLDISDSTMKGHKAGIMRKLGLKSSAEMILYARKNQLVME